MCSARPAYSTVKRISSAGVARRFVKTSSTGRYGETYERVLLIRHSLMTTGLNEPTANAAVLCRTSAQHTAGTIPAIWTSRRNAILPSTVSRDMTLLDAASCVPRAIVTDYRSRRSHPCRRSSDRPSYRCRRVRCRRETPFRTEPRGVAPRSGKRDRSHRS